MYTYLLCFLFKDDFCDSDIEDSKVLGDIAEKEEINVGNGINHEEKEVKQVFNILFMNHTCIQDYFSDLRGIPELKFPTFIYPKI